ncbi:MAG: LuxR C-terminal-related transcriptional regulator [Bacillota bacterium]|nr:LuxR C-terminal-related transcriptional regulator [Bacillota bacterium]
MPQILTEAEIENISAESADLSTTAWPIIKNLLYPNLTDKDQLIIFCNHEGYTLGILSSPQVLDLCSRMNISQGACFREEICGTNAIALSMLLQKKVAIRGEQHYCQLFKDWSCVAAPIRSPGGNIIGLLDVSMDCEKGLENIPALVQLAVQYIEKMYEEKLMSRLTPPINPVSPELLLKLKILSIREKDVLLLLIKGWTENQIADEMQISKETVKTLKKRAFKKLSINSKIEFFNIIRELTPYLNTLCSKRGT